MAGRSVGSIEVTVDADTGKLRAQLIKGGHAAGKAGKEAIEAELQDLEASLGEIDGKAQARLLRKQIEASLRGIDVDIDVLEARRELHELEATAEAIELFIGAELSPGDIAEINLNLQRLREQAESDAINLRIEGDLTAFQARFNAVVQEMEHTRVDVTVGADIAAAVASVEALQQRIERGELTFKTNADLTQARLEVAAFRELQERDDIEIPVNVDISALDAALARARVSAGGGARQMGGQLGDDAGDAFLNSFSTRFKLLAAAVVTLAEPAAVALQGGLAAAVSLTSSAFAGLAAVAGTVPTILSAVGASATAVIVGMQGMGDALSAVSEEFAALAEGRDFNIMAEDVQAAMSLLHPAARQVVVAFADLKPELHAIQQAVQGELFAGLAGDLRELAATILPAVSRGLQGLAQDFNAFGRGVIRDLGAVDFAQFFADVRPAVDSVLDGFRALIRAVEPFLHAAAPAAQALAESFRKTAVSLEDMIDAGAKSGAITEFLVGGVESLQQWWELIRNLGDALFTIFQAGQASGDSFISTLADIVAQWDEWLESVEGQEALFTFFETGREVMSALVPVLEGLQGFFANLISDDAVERFADFAEAIGRILPGLGSLLELTGDVGILQAFADALAVIAETVEDIAPALEPLADAIHDVLDAVIEAATPLVRSLGEVIAELAGPVADVVRSLIPLVEVIGEGLSPVIESLVPVIGDLADIIADGLNAAMPVLVGVVEDLFDALGPVADDLMPLLVELMEELAPFVPDLAVAFAKLALSSTKLFLAFAPVISQALELATDVLPVLVPLLKLTAELLTLAADAAGLFATAVSRVAPFLGPVGLGLTLLDAGLGLATGGFEAMPDAVVKSTRSLGHVITVVKTAGKVVRSFAIDVQVLEPAFAVVAAASESLVAAVEEIVVVAGEMGLAFENAATVVSSVATEMVASLTDAATAVLAVGAAAVQANLIPYSDQLLAVKQAAIGASNASTAFASVIDLMVDPMVSVQSTSDDLRGTMQSLDEEIRKASEGVEGQTLSLSALDEEGRTNRALVRDQVTGITDWATAALAAGVANEEVAGTVQSLTDELVGQLVQMGLTEEQAKDYIAQLGLTPETVDTAIKLAGDAEAKIKLQIYQSLLDDLPPEVQSEVVALIAEGKYQEAAAKIESFEAMNPTSTVDVEEQGASAVESDIDRAARDRTTTITVRRVVETIAGIFGDASGGLLADGLPLGAVHARERAQAGRLLTGPTVIGGEAGMEAVIPLHRSLSMIDPSVRMMAAILRGEVPHPNFAGGTTVGKQINQAITVTTAVADPVAVAASVMNRAAAMAAL